VQRLGDCEPAEDEGEPQRPPVGEGHGVTASSWSATV
jgi:hypothetical protein